MLVYNTPNQSICAISDRAAGTVATTVQIYFLDMFVDATAIGEDIDSTISQAMAELIPTMPAIGMLSIDDYLALGDKHLNALNLN
jgi:hypothetical protein